MAQDMVLGEQTQQIANYTPKKQRIKLTLNDANDIAELMVKFRMTETEACNHLDINPVRWFEFKVRKKVLPEFSKAQERIRAARLKTVISAIDEAGDERTYDYVDKRGEVKSMTKPGDWRAKAWIAERILAPERLGQQQAVAPAQVNIYAAIGIDVERLLADGYSKAKRIVDVQEVQQIEHKSEWIVVLSPLPIVCAQLKDLVMHHKSSNSHSINALCIEHTKDKWYCDTVK